MAAIRDAGEIWSLVWGKYGLSGFNDRKWFSKQYIGIDQGAILLMIENYRTGMVWEYFCAIPVKGF